MSKKGSPRRKCLDLPVSSSVSQLYLSQIYCVALTESYSSAFCAGRKKGETAMVTGS